MGRVIYKTAGNRNRNEKEAERVSEFKYLGYTFDERDSKEGKQCSGRCVWGIGGRKWGDDFRRRMMMDRDLALEGARGGRNIAKKYLR
jgi:hypothetical protein